MIRQDSSDRSGELAPPAQRQSGGGVTISAIRDRAGARALGFSYER